MTFDIGDGVDSAVNYILDNFAPLLDLIAAAIGTVTNGLQATLMIIMYMIVQLAIAGGIVPIGGMDDVAQAMSRLTPGRWALSLLGMIVDINARIDAQMPKNTFADQFTVGSYGGSALLPSLVALGMLVSFARSEPGAQAALRARRRRRTPAGVTAGGGSARRARY